MAGRPARAHHPRQAARGRRPSYPSVQASHHHRLASAALLEGRSGVKDSESGDHLLSPGLRVRFVTTRSQSTVDVAAFAPPKCLPAPPAGYGLIRYEYNGIRLNFYKRLTYT